MTGRKKAKLWGGLGEGDLVVVDTAPIVYLLEDNARFAPRFRGLIEAVDRGEVQIAISTITLSEVLVGPLKNGLGVLAKRYEKALSSFEIVPVSSEIAVVAARLRAETGLRLPDAIQAATVLEIGAVALVSHDRDFSKLKSREGLQVLDGSNAVS